jgi:hypothetical protein
VTRELYSRLAPRLLSLIEFLLIAATAALIFFSSRGSSGLSQPRVFLALERACSRLARRNRLSVIAVGVSVIAIRVALIPILGIPQPRDHNVCSFLGEALSERARALTLCSPLKPEELFRHQVRKDSVRLGGNPHVGCCAITDVRGQLESHARSRTATVIAGVFFSVGPERQITKPARDPEIETGAGSANGRFDF